MERRCVHHMQAARDRRRPMPRPRDLTTGGEVADVRQAALILMRLQSVDDTALGNYTAAEADIAHLAEALHGLAGALLCALRGLLLLLPLRRRLDTHRRVVPLVGRVKGIGSGIGGGRPCVHRTGLAAIGRVNGIERPCRERLAEIDVLLLQSETSLLGGLAGLRTGTGGRGTAR